MASGVAADGTVGDLHWASGLPRRPASSVEGARAADVGYSMLRRALTGRLCAQDQSSGSRGADRQSDGSMRHVPAVPQVPAKRTMAGRMSTRHDMCIRGCHYLCNSHGNEVLLCASGVSSCIWLQQLHPEDQECRGSVAHLTITQHHNSLALLSYCRCVDAARPVPANRGVHPVNSQESSATRLWQRPVHGTACIITSAPSFHTARRACFDAATCQGQQGQGSRAARRS